MSFILAPATLAMANNKLQKTKKSTDGIEQPFYGSQEMPEHMGAKTGKPRPESNEF